MPNHYGAERTDTKTLDMDFYLIIARGAVDRGYRGRPTAKVTAGPPNLARNERAMRLKVSLPVALFEQPQIEASIKVAHPEQAVTIDASAIAKAVEMAIGMNVDVRVVEPEEE